MNLCSSSEWQEGVPHQSPDRGELPQLISPDQDGEDLVRVRLVEVDERGRALAASRL